MSDAVPDRGGFGTGTQQSVVLGSHMKSLLLATAITFAPFIIPARASSITAEVLAYACRGNVPDLKKEKDTEQNAGFCNAYISGWDDARFAFLQGTTAFCPPQATYKDMSVVLFDYLVTHKEARKLPAAEALMLAFKDKWPCD
jgi:Rap1a immunity proteins